MKVKWGERNLVTTKINLSKTISMKRSRWELSIDMVIHRGILKNNQITPLLCFTFIPKTGASFLLVIYLPIPTSHLRGRKNEYSAQRGWRPLANMYHSQNQRIYKEKSKTRNEAPYAEVWIGKLLQNRTCLTAFMGREHFNVQREVLLWGFA